MSEIVYDASFNLNYDYTFVVDFKEWAPLFEGLVHVHIGDGTNPDIIETVVEGQTVYSGGKGGYLYGKYSDGYWQDIGYVSDYYAAKKYYEDHGMQIELTYQEWVEILMAIPENALQSKLWAYGRDEGDYVSGKSSREQANRAAVWAVGSTTDSDDGSATNNAKYWAEQSKSYTNGKDLDDVAVQERATDNAEYFKDLAKDWATKSTAVEGNLESAKTYAENAESSASSASSSATTATTKASEASISAANAATSETNASNSETSAEQWATGGTGSTYSLGNSAKEQADRAAVWASGSSAGDGDATHNAKYWYEQAYDSASTALTKASEAATSASNASISETNASASETNAAASASSADTSAINAAASALTASTKAGEASTSADNAANSVYLAEASATQAASSASTASTKANEAASSASNAATSATNASVSEVNASTSASNAAGSATIAQQWATGNTSGTYSTGNSAKEQADRAAVWASGASTGSGSATNNAKYWADQAAGSANSASSSAASCTTQINEKLTEIQTATNAANAATANTNTAISNANLAATNANTAADKLENITATATRLPSGSTPTATVTTESGHYVLNLGLEAGDNADVSSYTVQYQNSTSGVNVPTGTWDNAPNPTQGQYMWTKTTLNWNNGHTTVIHSVSYIGVNGTGSVSSVNGKGGDVTLYMSDITMAPDDPSRMTPITNNEIDALFV